MTALSQDERVAVARLQALLELLPSALDRHLLPAGLTAFEFTLLEVLAAAEEGRMRLSVLAAKTNASLARMSRVATSLERKGFIQRVPCPADSRATNAVITPEGEAAHARSRTLHAAAVRSLILDTLSAQDVADLSRLSLAILSQLDPVGGQTGTCPADPALVGSGT